ncbi:MAG: RNA polymerase sigma-70 factor (ECF subfamily) [Myxococcota bacterium]|jgi:RNA polymerase sigma-70 factor (ECF subfamily)
MASLIRVFGDWQVAEDALMDATERALVRWPRDGTPDDPIAWLLTTARRSGIDQIRRASTRVRTANDVALDLTLRAEERQDTPMQRDDDTLRLVFTCCHPALSREAQVALTLRTIGGLTAEEIARAFLVPTTTMAQRLVRARRKIHGAGIPFRIPEGDERAGRMSAVLRVIYLIFNEGYASTQGDTYIRRELCDEALRLCEVLCGLVPDPEASGLWSLMQFHHARSAARIGANGEPILLADQDRSAWDHSAIIQAHTRLMTVLTSTPAGPYMLQACIAGCHCGAATFDETDWRQVSSLYLALLHLQPTPVIRMNYAVAVAFDRGWQTGLNLLDGLAQELTTSHTFHTARSQLLERLGRKDEAITAVQTALRCVGDSIEQRWLEQRLMTLTGATA